MQSLRKIIQRTKVASILPRSKLARGVFVLSGGNAIGQLIVLLAAPLITRLYAPSQFGVMALYVSITVILGVVVSLRYEAAIALPESDKDALVLVRLCLFIVGLMTVLVFGGSLFYRYEVAFFLGVPELSDHLLLVPVSVLLIGFFNVFRSWCIRKGEFSSVSKARVTQVLSSVIIQLVGSPLGSISLILGQLANQGAGSIRLGKIALGRSDFGSYTISDMKRLLVRYKKFPLVTSWASLLSKVGQHLPTFFLSFYFGAPVAGVYALSNRVLNSPAVIFTNSIRSVFLAAAARKRHSGGLAELTQKTHELLSIVFMPPLLLASLLLPQIFGIVFGSEWISAGDYAPWIILIIYWTFAVSPFGSLFSILEKQEYELYFQIQLILLRITGFVIGGYTGSPLVSIAIFSLITSAHYLIVLFWLFRHLKIDAQFLVMQIARAIFVSLAVVSPLILVSMINTESVMVYRVCVLVSLLLCGLWTIGVYRYKFLGYKQLQNS